MRLERLVAGGRLSCEEVPGQRDRYGRRISRCTVGGADVAATLVTDGLAWAYRRYSPDYVALEEGARARGRGVWQARTDAPWHVRRGTGRGRGEIRGEARGQGVATNRNDVDSPAPPGCPIKGNLSAGGRIYHVPGSRSYARTVIRTERGERWFCSETEARAAGWRRSL